MCREPYRLERGVDLKQVLHQGPLQILRDQHGSRAAPRPGHRKIAAAQLRGEASGDTMTLSV